MPEITEEEALARIEDLLANQPGRLQHVTCVPNPEAETDNRKLPSYYICIPAESISPNPAKEGSYFVESVEYEIKDWGPMIKRERIGTTGRDRLYGTPTSLLRRLSEVAIENAQRELIGS